MDQVTVPKPLEEVDVDSTQSSSSADDVPQPQEPETSGNDSGPESDENPSEIEDETSSHPNGNASSIPHPSVGAGEQTETPPSTTPVSEPISPAEAALKEIENQETHCLYCSICKSNITKDAVLVKKGEETYPYNTAPYVMWVPRFNLSWIPRFNLSRIPRFNPSWTPRFNLSRIPRFKPSWTPRNLKDITLPSPRFLLALVLLVLAITVMWFHHSPVIPPPGPVVTPPGPVVTPPGPVIPRPGPVITPPGHVVTPPGPVVTPPGPVITPPGPVITPPGPVVTPPGPVVTPPGPVVTPPGPVIPRPGPVITPPGPVVTPPGPVITPPGPVVTPPDPYIKRGWPIHFLSSKYLSIFSLLLLAILALLWPSISTGIDSLIKAAIERCRGIENPIRPLCRKARNFINYLKGLVTPDPKPKPVTDPKPKPVTDPKPKPVTDPKTKPVTDPTRSTPGTDSTPDQDPNTGTDPAPDQGTDPAPVMDPTLAHDDPIRFIKKIVDRLGNLDILKSIVYGGLIESITSLGVVSSAAASGATTLNVLALGVTSLFSGFILMCHSLRELVAKHKKAEEKAKKDPEQKEKKTPYQTQLGNYRNVILHCFVVLASFLVFGLIPPLCYGLFFRESDKGHYKAAVVLAVSLVCVTLLASAKVYAFQLEKKLRTVWEYTGMAVTASALSFITSQIFSDMLEKYGFRKPASD